MIIPKGAIDALQVRNFLKKNTIEPQKVYENVKYNEKLKLYVYTFQCGFKTEQELKIFRKLCTIINIGMLEGI